MDIIKLNAGDLFTVKLPCDIEIAMVYCPPGTFMMGTPLEPGEDGRCSFTVAHKVTLTKGFWIGKFTVTQQQYEPLIGLNPSENQAPNLPVTNVNLCAGKWYAKKLNDLLATDVFRMPTEAEWEYACRAGSIGDFAGTGRLEDMGWFADNSGRIIHPGGEKMPNDWGIHDMHGNVWEWCDDEHNFYPQEAVVDPLPKNIGVSKIIRGGSCSLEAKQCTAWHRESMLGNSRMELMVGFRLAANDDPKFFKQGGNP